MRTPRVGAPAALVALLLLPASAHAAGTLTGLGASPSPATTGQPVTFTVTGAGGCEFSVVYGGGEPSDNLVASQFPLTFGKTFGRVGIYLVTVKPRQPSSNPCEGDKTITLTVDAPAPAQTTRPVLRLGENPCPSGWHPGGAVGTYKGGKTFLCVPTRPPRIQCGPNTVYVETSCGFGCQAVPQ